MGCLRDNHLFLEFQTLFHKIHNFLTPLPHFSDTLHPEITVDHHVIEQHFHPFLFNFLINNYCIFVEITKSNIALNSIQLFYQFNNFCYVIQDGQKLSKIPAIFLLHLKVVNFQTVQSNSLKLFTSTFGVL